MLKPSMTMTQNRNGTPTIVMITLLLGVATANDIAASSFRLWAGLAFGTLVIPTLSRTKVLQS